MAKKIDPPKKKYKRDLTKPLSESKFDPADYNNDGHVTPQEQRKYNRAQALKKKGAETPTEKSNRRLNVAKNIVNIASDVAKTAIDLKDSKNRGIGF